LKKASVPRLVDETYKTLGQAEAAHALILMEELGLLEGVLPILSAHLKKREGTLAEQAVVRNVAALGKAIGAGFVPDHHMVLGGLMLDLYRAESARPSAHRVDLLGELRARGFARGDTEHMRLILDAFENLSAPTRRTRRLVRRPYFPDARIFFEMMAPTYPIDMANTMRFLTDPDGFVPSQAQSAAANQTLGQKRRRRRRRGRRIHTQANDTGTQINGDEQGADAGAESPRSRPVARNGVVRESD
jgi:hypothetical protein